MGTLRSLTDLTGITVNGIILGKPVEEEGLFLWDDSAFPTGLIEKDGTVIIDEEVV